MKDLLFLRGEIPTFRPDRLPYNSIDECEDVWTVLAERITRKLGSGELWYWGGDKQIKVTDYFKERWHPKFEPLNKTFKYIIARGGFKQYEPIITSSKGAKLIYYGAGTRYYPKQGFKGYDLILVDTETQAEKVKKLVKQGKIHGEVGIIPKPAAPMFKPKAVAKKYGVCFPANPAPFKGHDNMFKALSGSNLTVMCVGIPDKRIQRLADKYKVNAIFLGWHRRHKLSALFSQCWVGLVMTAGYRDSCPRVIPEMIACGLPVVVADYVNVSDVHINKSTGERVPESQVLTTVKDVIKNYGKYTPRQYYDNNLTVDIAANKVVSMLEAL